MDLIRNLKKWSKISSKHFFSRICQFSPKMVIFAPIAKLNLLFLAKNDGFWWKLTALRPRKKAFGLFLRYEPSKKCSKMLENEEFKIKKKKRRLKKSKKS